MKLSLLNTFTRKIEEFSPINADLVSMYVCGPTVYDRAHIGNARSAVVYDLLYRILIKLFSKEKVRYVRNITDIDDKIINKALAERISIQELTEKTTEYFHKDMAYLNCLAPNFQPKATEHIDVMIEIIEKLIANGYAYEAEGHIYFAVGKYEDYTKLSGQNFDEIINAVRKEYSAGKNNPEDFVLWKPAKEGEDPSAIFDSPFGKGRPGWHIECSAMSYKFLGSSFDIHGGGGDLVFPHHSNEIAQSCCAFPGSSYAKMWVHNGFLTVGREKMSKSLGNFITMQDIIEQNINGDVLRLFFFTASYHKPLDYNVKALRDAKHSLDYWYRAVAEHPHEVEAQGYDESSDIPEEFIEALLDNMNTPRAIKLINDYAKICHTTEDESVKNSHAKYIWSCARFMGLMRESYDAWNKYDDDADASYINSLIEERRQAKLAKNWAQADKIRNKLTEMGVVLEDHPDSTTSWRI